jgi:hypothetical protein
MRDAVCPAIWCSGVIDFGDINPFVQYLANFAQWQATYPSCPAQNGDINGDGSYPAFSDINPFVSLMAVADACPQGLRSNA